MKKVVKILKPLEWIFYFISLAILLFCGIYFKSNAFDIIASVISLCAVFLNLNNKKYCFFFYAIYVLIYGIISFINKQYGEGVINLVYNLPLYLFTIYGFYLSKKKKQESSEFVIKSITKKQLIVMIVLIPIITVLYGLLLNHLGSASPYLNSLATAFALSASFLASRTIKEQWIAWIIYSLILFVLWLITFISNGNGLMFVILNALYILINTYGLIVWIRKFNESKKQ